tara:strand:+ start:32 stop:433 length:402 start_codon:yes stop_codon:yes gene_type:complete
MRKILKLISILFVLSFNIVVFAGEIDATNEANLSESLKLGKTKAEQICSACHGIDGIAASGGNSPMVPNLSGQNKDYLAMKLKEYKTNKIEHPQMSMIAQMLTEEDISNVSEWYSSIKVKVFDPNKVLVTPGN